MTEIQIQSEIEKLKNISNNGIEKEELDDAKSILEVLKSGKASKSQLEEIIKILNNETKGIPGGDFIKFNLLSNFKSDFENLLANYNEEKQVIVNDASDSTQEVKGTIVKPINETSESSIKSYNEKKIKTFQKRIENVISKLDENNEEKKKLKEELEKLLANPNNSSVEIIQTILISMGKNISKSGNADGYFGPKTMKALENVTGIKVVDNTTTTRKQKKSTKRNKDETKNKVKKETKKTETNNFRNINYQNIIIDKASELYIEKYDIETILKNINNADLSKSSSLYKLKTQLEKNHIDTREFLKGVKENTLIIHTNRKGVKASDGSIMDGEFEKYKGKLTLINGTRKFKDGRVDIYEKGEKKNYMIEYMALMAVMVGVDLAGFTGVGTIPSLLAGTSYDIYDLTQKEDAGWQALKKMGLVDKRYYAGDKGILEYSLNVLGLVPGMTAAAKLYQIQKFSKGLSAAEKAKFDKLESFMKDRFFGIGETAAKKGKIGQEYSREANDLRKAREKAAKEKKKTAKTAETTVKEGAKNTEHISDEIYENFIHTGKVPNEIIENICQKLYKGEKTSAREAHFASEKEIAKRINERMLELKKIDDLKSTKYKWSVEPPIDPKAEPLVNGLKKGTKIDDTIIKGDELIDVSKDLEKKYGKEKAGKIIENLSSALNGLKKVKKYFPASLEKDVDNGIQQFLKDIFLSKWNLVGALAGAGIDQFLLDNYVDGVDRMEVFLKSLLIGYLAGTAFNIAGKGLKYTLSGTGSVGRFIWRHKGKLVLGGVGTYIACERTNYDSFSEMFTDWLTKEKQENPTPTHSEEGEIPQG